MRNSCPRSVDAIVVVLDEVGALAHALAERVQQLGVALVVGDGEKPRALVVSEQRLIVIDLAGSAHGGGQCGEGGLGQEALVVVSGARARLVVGGDMVAGLAVVEPAGPGVDAQGHQHSVVGEVHGRGLRIRRCLPGPGGGPADEGRGVLQSRVARHARADEELTDLAPEPRRVGDDGAEIDVVGHAVERTAERYQRARVVGNGGVLGIVDDGPGVGQFAPDLEEGGELDRRRLADGAPEQRALGGRIKTVPVLQDVGNEAPVAGRQRRPPATGGSN